MNYEPLLRAIFSCFHGHFLLDSSVRTEKLSNIKVSFFNLEIFFLAKKCFFGLAVLVTILVSILTLKDMGGGGIIPLVRRLPAISHRIMLWSQKFLTLSINISTRR